MICIDVMLDLHVKRSRLAQHSEENEATGNDIIIILNQFTQTELHMKLAVSEYILQALTKVPRWGW